MIYLRKEEDSLNKGKSKRQKTVIIIMKKINFLMMQNITLISIHQTFRNLGKIREVNIIGKDVDILKSKTFNAQNVNSRLRILDHSSIVELLRHILECCF